MLTEQDEKKTTANSNKVRYIMNTNTATSTAITYNQETADRRSAYDQIGRGLSLTGLENWLAERYMDIAREYLRGQSLMFRDVYSDLTGICEWASGAAKEIESYANVGDIDAEIRVLTQQDIDNAGIIAGEE